MENKIPGKSRTKDFLQYNRKALSRIYPKGQRVESSNYDPYPLWAVGCHMVALNYQTAGTVVYLGWALRKYNCSETFWWPTQYTYVCPSISVYWESVTLSPYVTSTLRSLTWSHWLPCANLTRKMQTLFHYLSWDRNLYFLDLMCVNCLSWMRACISHSFTNV